ncbi:MAG: exodeoxyribonuclease VII large subunit [Desulfobacteraceae bacterium]|nr:exodeoxyribonuclease VII large subunit [Desulfobacteraceae bacterium]
MYTVSKLTREIKSLLEDSYPFIWVTGEISNYVVPASGHAYFTLKDHDAIISGVLFKNQKLNLKFKPENGLKIIGMARLTLYEPRGSYQLIFEHLEPEGAGSMQVAFEQLKKRLSQKGFFDDEFKKPIPFLPAKINVITSGTGAAIKDIIIVCQRRFSNCCLEIVPVKVQGEESENQISDAINFVNKHHRSDLIILARGGGSLEDLAAFNSEIVATAIFKSNIPIITGVGHETDFTIADFVADLRAPTPSAAAELALPDKKSVHRNILQLQERLQSSLTQKISYLHEMVLDLVSRLKSPENLVCDFRFRLEDYESRLMKSMDHYIQYNKEKVNWASKALYSKQPTKRISDYRKRVRNLTNNLKHHFQSVYQRVKTNHLELTSKLLTLNPESVLKRGYSISRSIPDKILITDSSSVKKNDQIEVILSKGRLMTKVEKTNG